MTISARAAAGGALLLALAACQVTVDNKTEAQIDNSADKLGDQLDNAAQGAANTAEQLGNKVEQGADKIGNGVDVKVNLHGDDNASANQQ
jgi:hypothetical protein